MQLQLCAIILRRFGRNCACNLPIPRQWEVEKLLSQTRGFSTVLHFPTIDNRWMWGSTNRGLAKGSLCRHDYMKVSIDRGCAWDRVRVGECLSRVFKRNTQRMAKRWSDKSHESSLPASLSLYRFIPLSSNNTLEENPPVGRSWQCGDGLETKQCLSH